MAQECAVTWMVRDVVNWSLDLSNKASVSAFARLRCPRDDKEKRCTDFTASGEDVVSNRGSAFRPQPNSVVSGEWKSLVMML